MFGIMSTNMEDNPLLKISYAGKSRPSAQKLAEEGDVLLIRSSHQQADVNWGRSQANARLNPNISNVTNKRIMRQLFQEDYVPMPTLYSLREASEVLADRWGKAQLVILIGRPDQHSKGRGLWKITDRKSLDKALKGTRKKKPATHFMEYIDKERAPREYRVHIFNGKSIRISEKEFTNDGKYTTAKPRHNVTHIRKAAKQAVAAVGLDFGAVDILANDDTCWVLEVNAAPGLGGTMPKLYLATFNQWKEEQSE